MNQTRVFTGLAIVFTFASVVVLGQSGVPDLHKQVSDLSAQGNYAELAKLIDQQENLWKTAPGMDYFSNMSVFADFLTDAKDTQIYWLGRKVIWNVLLKPAPNTYGAPEAVYLEKRELLRVGAETTTFYVDSSSPKMFALIRHDTFLMLSEYARQAHAIIIPGFRRKPVLMSNPHTQDAIDIEAQTQAGYVLDWLSTGQDDYLIEAYSREPRDDQELKALLDILNIQGGDRGTIIGRVTQGRAFGVKVQGPSVPAPTAR